MPHSSGNTSDNYGDEVTRTNLLQDELKRMNPAGSFQEKFVFFTARRNGFPADSGFEEEPIDLSNYSKDLEGNRSESSAPTHGFSDTPHQLLDFEPRLEVQSFQLVDFPENNFNIPRDNYLPRSKRKRKKFVFTQEGKLLLVTRDHHTETTFTPTKHQEILNAAKALFSKRTRTLYHWMYPDAAKQQIKTVIANSWDSLEDKEKEFYISQVLGRFGYPQSNLMINPQLGTIKHLPPPPESEQPRYARPRGSHTSPPHSVGVAMTGRGVAMAERGVAMAERGVAMIERGGATQNVGGALARRRGRPKVCHASQRGSARDFQDDPELSQELEKFAMTFDLSSVV